MDQAHDTGSGIPFFGYMTSKGPVIISHPQLSSMEAFSIVKGVYTSSDSSTDDGGDNMEYRIAVLETDVARIKSDISDIKTDQRIIASDAASASSDIKVVLQKLIDIDANLSTKAGKDYVESAVSGMKVWLLGILLLSIAMPIITFLINLYLKKP